MDPEPAEPASRQSHSPNPEVTRAVGELPEIYRQVVLLRYYAGLSCAEISRDLEVPLGTATKRLSRAYSLLREYLQEQNPQEKC